MGLIQNINSDEIKAENILTGKTNRLCVIVEDETDERFWGHIFEDIGVEKEIEFMIYSSRDINGETRVAKGKSFYINELNSLGDYLIACFDSDYDYLLNESTDLIKEFNSNPYVIQTFAYSKENFLCHSKSLNSICRDAVTKRTSHDFEVIISDFSEAIHPLLIINLFLQHKNTPNINRNILSSLDLNSSICNFTTEENFNLLKNAINKKIEELKTTYSECEGDEFNMFQADINSKLLNNGYTYMFVNGHDLICFFKKHILQPICDELIKNHKDTILEYSPNKAKRENIDHYNNMCYKLDQVIEINKGYIKNSHIYNNILKLRIREVFNLISTC